MISKPCRILRILLSSGLVFAMLLSSGASAFAEHSASLSVINQDEIQTLFDQYIDEKGLNADIISIAYYYSATGESWFFQEDKWYYSASLYKVPLMMLLAEKEYAGELSEDSLIYGMALKDIEEAVLRYSDNDIAYSMLLYQGDPNTVRAKYRIYSELPEEYYDWAFYSSSYFTARFMNDVMIALYENPERYPGVIENLKLAQPDHYFRAGIKEDFDIAQKYGSYHDEDENDWNHATGIFYTPNPFVLTVMTRYGGMAEMILSDLAVLFRDYTLLADTRLITDIPDFDHAG